MGTTEESIEPLTTIPMKDSLMETNEAALKEENESETVNDGEAPDLCDNSSRDLGGVYDRKGRFRWNRFTSSKYGGGFEIFFVTFVFLVVGLVETVCPGWNSFLKGGIMIVLLGAMWQYISWRIQDENREDMVLFDDELNC